MSAPETRVRVTLEGAVQQSVRTEQVLRFRTVRDDGTAGPLVLIDTRWQGVTVETLAPVWEWSEGDVVAGDTLVYTQGSVAWVAWTAGGHPVRLEDWQVSEAAGSPEGYDVLRYANGA